MPKIKFGRSPWGKWFVEVLEGYDIESRLERGRSYAATGKVTSLEASGNKVRAKVRGHYKPFYNVEIIYPALTESESALILALIDEDAPLLAEITAGKLPESFLNKLKKAGINLIPKTWADMTQTCDCPDNVKICKHIASVYYSLSRDIDNDGHILFKLRGLDLTTLVEKHGASFDTTLEAPFEITAIGEDEIAGGNASASGSALGRENNCYTIEEIPACTSLITSLLPPHPSFLVERDFSMILAQFYHDSMRRYYWNLSDKINEDEEHSASRSEWLLQCDFVEPGAPLTLVQKTVRGAEKKYDVYEAFINFRSFSTNDGSETYLFLLNFFKFLNLVISAGAFSPYPIVDCSKLKIIWLIYDNITEIKNSLNSFYAFKSKMLNLNTKRKVEASRGYMLKRGEAFADGKTIVNLISSAVLSEFVRRSAFGINDGGVKVQKFAHCFFEGLSLDVDRPATRSIPLAIKRWLSVLYTDFTAYKYRISLKEKLIKSELDNDPLSMEFTVQFDVEIDGKLISLKDAARLPNSLSILKAPTALSNYLGEIRDLFTNTHIMLREERLINFLDYASPLLSRLGIEIVLPKKLHRELSPRLVIKAEGAAKNTDILIKYLEIDKILKFNWEIAIGDTVLKQGEFEKLLKQKRSVVRFKNHFIKIDPEKLASLMKKLEEQRKESISSHQFIREHFAGNTELSVSANEVINKLTEVKNYPPPASLTATLREYQHSGYNWVLSLLMSGFGAILADDMGLGKTIQSIAVLLRLKEEGLLQSTALIIAPAALLLNWERELGNFAPSIRVARYHGKGRVLDKDADVLLTTYQTAVRDFNKLNEDPFSLLVVDEAHLMKNEETRISRTVKQLRSQYRLALSGTPVENRLEDMRSIFDYIIPGFLGGKEKFKQEFRVPVEVERRKDKADELRKITSPFLLRRLKTDKKIISDLPQKIICNEYSSLEKEQAALYQSVVTDNLEKIEKAKEGGMRSALVLGLLTALKQICDHPRVFDKESPCASRLSGKASLLVTLLREIISGGEKVLIFSQYVEALMCIQKIIIDELDENVLLYYGAMSQKARSEAIDKFQNDSGCPIMLVSLRAGGLGLNLTAASRVIHYDLWYNPAVEAQATDRAFRIGQKRNVFVHRLITKNTFEEKIDAMLNSKKELADLTVSTGEAWLAKMTNDELRELFAR
jgi:SNF2 family DNA or RNA helicase/uncharacterized Zn finger protein